MCFRSKEVEIEKGTTEDGSSGKGTSDRDDRDRNPDFHERDGDDRKFRD